MEKRRTKKRRSRPEPQFASLGLVWENIKFSFRAFFRKRSSRRSITARRERLTFTSAGFAKNWACAAIA
jgi:hypothetical protein